MNAAEWIIRSSRRSTFRLSTERRKKTKKAKIAIQDEFSFRMERGQGSRVSDCSHDFQRIVDRFLELAPLSTAYGISSGVQGRNSHSLPAFRSQI